MPKIPIEVSARHIHLSREDLDALFGEGFELTVKKELSQPGMFSANEKVTIIYGDQKIENVRIVGPVRDETQLELSFSDAIRIGAKPQIRISGDIEGTDGFKIIGLKGEVEKNKGMIIAQRHLHVSEEDAAKYSLIDGEEICFRVSDTGKRGLAFCNVKIRVASNYKLSFHVDTDEGNAAGMLDWCGYGEIEDRKN